jgi:hypothetical protein
MSKARKLLEKLNEDVASAARIHDYLTDNGYRCHNGSPLDRSGGCTYFHDQSDHNISMDRNGEKTTTNHYDPITGDEHNHMFHEDRRGWLNDDEFNNFKKSVKTVRSNLGHPIESY